MSENSMAAAGVCMTSATGTIRIHATEGSRTLAAVGAFRVVPEQDFDIDHETLDHLRDEGLVDVVDLGDDERGVTLTKDGRDLLDSHLMDRGDEPSQAFYAGVSRSCEIDHDSNLYATYRQEEARLASLDYKQRHHFSATWRGATALMKRVGE